MRSRSRPVLVTNALPPFYGLDLEAAVELGHVVLPQKSMGCLQRLHTT